MVLRANPTDFKSYMEKKRKKETIEHTLSVNPNELQSKILTGGIIAISSVIVALFIKELLRGNV